MLASRTKQPAPLPTAQPGTPVRIPRAAFLRMTSVYYLALFGVFCADCLLLGHLAG